jgi:hypothetical protein
MKAPILLAFLGLATAQAAEPTLTLSCEGTIADNMEPDAKQPISMGIVLNFTTRTVQGFPFIGDAEITKVDDGRIVFVASYDGSKEVHVEWGFVGTIDRVTGDLKAHWMLLNIETGNSRIVAYSLKCQPTQRMFYRQKDGALPSRGAEPATAIARPTSHANIHPGASRHCDLEHPVERHPGGGFLSVGVPPTPPHFLAQWMHGCLWPRRG